MVVLQPRRCRASLPEVVDVGAAPSISQGYGNLHILWNVPRNLLMEDVALDESHRRQVSLFTCFGDDALLRHPLPEQRLCSTDCNTWSNRTFPKFRDIGGGGWVGGTLVQEVVVVAESTTNNPAFLPTPSVEIRVLRTR